MFAPQEFFSLPFFKECTFVWELLACIGPYIDFLEHKIEIEVGPNVFLSGPEKISIGRGTKIAPGVFIEGPCVIGKDCEIGHGAYIRPGTILGDRCVIGHAAEVKNSILCSEARATHFTYVGDSILGFRVNLGAGVKCANLRLDRKPVAIVHDGKRWETGLLKMGAIVGDFSQVGCNAVLNPGTLLYPGSVVAPLSSVGGNRPRDRYESKTEVQ